MKMRTVLPLIAAFVILLPAFFWMGRESVGTSTDSRLSRSTAAAKPSSPPSAHDRLKETASDNLAQNIAHAQDKKPIATPDSHDAASIATKSASKKDNSPQPNAEPPVPAGKLLADFIDKTREGVFLSPTAQGHDLVQKEVADPNWSPVANQQLGDFVNDQMGDRFETPTIDCRTDICEITAASTRSGIEADSLDFQQAMMRLREQPWFASSGFDMQGFTMAVSYSPDHRALFVMYITRK